MGILGANSALLFGATGPILRGSGIACDLRASALESYGIYRMLSFRSYIGICGDSYDRFLIRSRELFESMHIIYSAIAPLLSSNGRLLIESKIARPASLSGNTGNFKNKMESLIRKFKNAVDPVETEASMSYRAVESGKGEFGVLLVSNNTQKPYRVYLRSPAYNHLQLLSLIGAGHMFADIVTLVGTLDLVFGEIDR